MMGSNKNGKEFSKTLLIQESILVWFISTVCLGLAYLCILKDYTGSLPWLSAMIGLPWAAYGVSQACYYNKAKAENTKDGIKYDSAMAELAAGCAQAIEEASEADLFSAETADNNDIDIYYGI